MAGLVTGALSLNDGSGGKPAPALRVEELSVAVPLTPDQVQVSFRLMGGNRQLFGARVEYVIRRPEDGGEEGPYLATITRSSGPENPLADVPPGSLQVLTWDASHDLRDGSADASMVVTPIEEGTDHEPSRSGVFRAGNTLPIIDDIQLGLALGSRADKGGPTPRIDLLINFEIKDAEENEVDVEGIELQIDGDGSFHSLPCDLLEALPSNMRRDLSSSIEGARSSLTVDIAQLAREDLRCRVDPELLPLSRPGFTGLVRARILARDFLPETLATGVGPNPPFLWDTNDPPNISSVSVAPEHGRGGVVPVRYVLTDPQALLDPEGHRAGVEVLVQVGNGPRITANEFPGPGSRGTKDLRADAASHVFFWDALSQVQGDQTVTIRITPFDAKFEEKRGLTHEERLQVSLPWLSGVHDVPAGEIPGAITAVDLDVDGFADAAVVNRGSGDLTHLRGGPQGLSLFQGSIPTTLQERVKPGPVAIVAGSFLGDALPDLAVANTLTGTVTFLTMPGGPEAKDAMLEPILEVTVDEASPDIVALASGDFDADGEDDVAVANGFSGRITCLRGRAEGSILPETVWFGNGPSALAVISSAGNESRDLVVANRNSGTVALLVGGPGCLTFASEIVTRREAPVLLVTGDFNGDGSDDVAAGHEEPFLTEIRIDAEGLREVRDTPLDGAPSALLGGDFNGDGSSDVAVAVGEKSSLMLFGGSPDGLTTLQFLSLSQSPSGLAAADLDGDGHIDLAVASRFGNSIDYFRGGRSGLMQTKRIHVGTLPISMATGDFEADGIDDLVAANQGSRNVSVIGGGAGGLTPLDVLGVGARPFALGIGDYDGDEVTDAVTLNQDSSSLSYLRGSSDGLLGQGDQIGIRGRPLTLTSGDFDAPGGARDLAVSSNPGINTVLSFLQGSPSGPELISAPTLTTGFFDAAQLASSSDYFGSDRVDEIIFYAGGGLPEVGVFALRDGSLQSLGAFSVGGDGAIRLRDIANGDYNGDGISDAAIARSAPRESKVVFLPGGSGPPDLTPRLIDTPEDVFFLSAGDHDGDGFEDVAAAHKSPPRLSWFRGGPSGLGDFAALGDLKSTPSGLAAGDFDGDGFSDIAMILEVAGGSQVIAHHGSLAGLDVMAGKPAALGLRFERIIAGDLEGDGFDDVLVTDATADGVTYLRGSELGLARIRRMSAEKRPSALGLGDFDADGFMDLAVANLESNTVSYFRNRWVEPHVNSLVMASALATLLDPRAPPRYRLEVPAEAFDAPTQVCILSGPAFQLPRRDFAPQALILVTDPVTISRTSTRLGAPALLTLRVRARHEELVRHGDVDPKDLKVFRLDEVLGRGVEVGTASMVDFEKGKGIRFSISRFGTYQGALVQTRG